MDRKARLLFWMHRISCWSPKRLAGFARFALDPGQQVRAHVPVPWRALAYFDERADAFVLEEGTHRLVVARDAEAEPEVSATLTLERRVVGR